MDKKCMRVNCDKDATHHLAMEIKARGSDAVAKGSASLLVCAEHATQDLADECLSYPQFRADVERTFFNGGYALPDWPRCKVTWEMGTEPQKFIMPVEAPGTSSKH